LHGNAGLAGVFISKEFVIKQNDILNKLKPLVHKHNSLSALAHEGIREKILSGDYMPGEWLRQEELSQQLGVSHTPVREALDRLVADGLVERVPHKGVRVSTIDENDIAEVYCLRLLLEPIVVRLAAINISEDQLKNLGAIVDQAEKMTSLDDMPPRRQLNREFHGMICKACGSEMLERLCEIIWNRFPDWMLYEGLYRHPKSLNPRLEREIKEHRGLLDAITERNVNLAEQLSASHIKGTKEDLIEVFEITSHIIEEKQQQMGL
jgi:DNA-binding GntR family transcriptional regulator